MKTDFPLFAAVIRLEAVQRNFPQSELIVGAMMKAKTVHEFAVAYWASWRYHGLKPVGMSNPFIDKAIALVEAVKLQMEQAPDKVSVETHTRSDKVLNPVQQRVTTNYDGFVEPSDRARLDAKLWRDEHGSTYVGPRTVRKREHCGQFDARYPLHWQM